MSRLCLVRERKEIIQEDFIFPEGNCLFISYLNPTNFGDPRLALVAPLPQNGNFVQDFALSLPSQLYVVISDLCMTVPYFHVFQCLYFSLSDLTNKIFTSGCDHPLGDHLHPMGVAR